MGGGSIIWCLIILSSSKDIFCKLKVFNTTYVQDAFFLIGIMCVMSKYEIGQRT